MINSNICCCNYMASSKHPYFCYSFPRTFALNLQTVNPYWLATLGEGGCINTGWSFNRHSSGISKRLNRNIYFIQTKTCFYVKTAQTLFASIQIWKASINSKFIYNKDRTYFEAKFEARFFPWVYPFLHGSCGLKISLVID